MIAPICHGSRRRGWSLLELTAVLALLGVLLALTFATVAGSFRTEKASMASFHKLAVQSALADLFRADVAGARAAPDKLNALAKGPACLILELPDRSYIVYRWDKGRLTRSTFAGTKTAEQDVPLGEKAAAAGFSWSAGHALVTLRIAAPQIKDAPRAPLEITAALGGDNR